MAHGIVTAILVSAIWIVLQNVLMHLRPAEHRLRAMFLGYCISLPFVFVVYRFMPPLSDGIAQATRGESPVAGLIHAYCLHLLLFFLYAECFYHLERSVTLRMFLELLPYGDGGATQQAIQSHYSVDDMVQKRLELMQNRGLIELIDNSWRLRSPGMLLARFASAGSWLFQFKAQNERG